MMRRMSALLLVLAAPVLAQTAPPPVAPVPVPTVAPAIAPAPKYETVRVTITTSLGPIVVDLEKQRAPITTANFLKYVDQKRLDGTTFYRRFAMPDWPELGFVQGGTTDPKRVLPAIAHEPTTKTGLKHEAGSISMARFAPGTAKADFFITLGPNPAMDANPKASGDNAGFAVFGKVASGMDVVFKIHAAAVSPTKGIGVMKGQMIEAPIKILTVRRTK